jgi:hypothetical protein
MTRARIRRFMNKFRNLGYFDCGGSIAVRRRSSIALTQIASTPKCRAGDAKLPA